MLLEFFSDTFQHNPFVAFTAYHYVIPVRSYGMEVGKAAFHFFVRRSTLLQPFLERFLLHVYEHRRHFKPALPSLRFHLRFSNVVQNYNDVATRRPITRDCVVVSTITLEVGEVVVVQLVPIRRNVQENVVVQFVVASRLPSGELQHVLERSRIQQFLHCRGFTATAYSRKDEHFLFHVVLLCSL